MIPLRLGKKPNKNKAKAVEVDGIRFDSTVEAQRYGELKVLERAGEVKNIEVHPRFKIVINGIPICTVVADFMYTDTKANIVRVEDVKGRDNAMSKLRRKLVLACSGIGIEVLKRRKR